MTGRPRQDESGQAVAIWRRAPDGPVRATAVSDHEAALPHPVLAALIARRVLREDGARVVLDQVVTLPPHAARAPAPGTGPALEPDEQAHGGHDDCEPAPPVADPQRGTVLVMSYAGSNSPC